MDLTWDKQIQVMNKQVMDWRWKSLAAKGDPAQLKCSVTEYLLPRLEIGLAHANVTKCVTRSYQLLLTPFAIQAECIR